MSVTLVECFLYALVILSLGSYSAAFSIRWPIKQRHEWNKEAHQLLEQTFTAPFPNEAASKRSHCPHCQHTLNWKDLFPLLSFLLLKGKCRYCKKMISYRYPIIESLHFICCLPLLFFYQDVYQLALMTILISALITSASIDFEHRLIPDECNVIALGCALLSHLQSNTLNNSVLAMLVGYSSLYLLRWAYLTLRHKEGLGLGDVKLVAALGAWLGIMNLAPLLLCASLGGILYTVVITRKAPTQLAFGPFLIFSAIILFYYSKL
ncbi:prepilin peptidase [Marinomonas transparens]|uniref:Prepilin leader peptidase/N-methyltransferase n=1 Tax=Marinomonas transparens TaxID=2795388 RepID=A0A934JLR6_9GAMM|nr:A24 family peptidase [Marinomonas transparens]MBJ7538126.1 prepilin peptidase [Marinomonas transparens]